MACMPHYHSADCKLVGMYGQVGDNGAGSDINGSGGADTDGADLIMTAHITYPLIDEERGR